MQAQAGDLVAQKAPEQKEPAGCCRMHREKLLLTTMDTFTQGGSDIIRPPYDMWQDTKEASSTPAASLLPNASAGEDLGFKVSRFLGSGFRVADLAPGLCPGTWPAVLGVLTMRPARVTASRALWSGRCDTLPRAPFTRSASDTIACGHTKRPFRFLYPAS